MIYLIQDEATCFIKIGHIDGPVEDRLRVLQTASPGRLVVLMEFEGNRTGEAQLHADFKQYHERGEWFRAGPKLLKFLFDQWYAHGFDHGCDWNSAEKHDRANKYVAQRIMEERQLETVP